MEENAKSNQNPIQSSNINVEMNQPNVPISNNGSQIQNQEPINTDTSMMGVPMNNSVISNVPLLMVPANPYNLMNGYQKLMAAQGISIKQKIELIEAVTGCEFENRYIVYLADQTGEKLKQTLFKAREKSNCCARICLSGDCRPFTVDVEHKAEGSYSTNDGTNFLHFVRKFKCTCCCLARPSMHVYYTEGNQSTYLGRIFDPCTINLYFHVYGPNDEKLYTVYGDCCQLGIWCRCPCEPCQTVDFEVRDANGNKVSDFQKVINFT